MDVEKRRMAKAKIEKAKDLDRSYGNKDKGKVLLAYMEGIGLFLQISEKTRDDFEAVSNAYYSIAIIYFNTKDYTKSGEAYLNSIQQLLQIEPSDDIYRQITERYVDLADACYELHNQSAGDEAMANAIKAFKLIKEKNIKERELGVPDANLDNFRRFHLYYEEQLSSTGYLKSSRYINHESLLGKGLITRQEDNALLGSLFEKLENITIGEINQIDVSISNMLGQLSVTTTHVRPFFNPISLNQAPDDDAYRKFAMQLLSLAQSYIKNTDVTNTIKTYEQVIDTLRLVQEPEDNDQKIMLSLREQINFLNTKSSDAISQSSSQRAAPSSSRPRFFSSSVEERERVSPSTEEEYDNMMYQ